MVRAGRDDMSDKSSDRGSDSVADDDAQANEDKEVDQADEVDILLDLRPGEISSRGHPASAVIWLQTDHALLANSDAELYFGEVGMAPAFAPGCGTWGCVT
jgi:hypothetical protein